jgi:putative PIN family toxin of toxin-antitoxin system
MIRVVLDTNILTSSLLNPAGPPAQVFLMNPCGLRYAASVSAGTFMPKYEEVIRRPRCTRRDDEIGATLRTIREKGFWVRSSEKVHACSDPDDDIFLECAQAAAAHYLITGNTKDFPPAWAGTQIVTARQFLDAIV